MLKTALATVAAFFISAPAAGQMYTHIEAPEGFVSVVRSHISEYQSQGLLYSIPRKGFEGVVLLEKTRSGCYETLDDLTGDARIWVYYASESRWKNSLRAGKTPKERTLLGLANGATIPAIDALRARNPDYEPTELYKKTGTITVDEILVAFPGLYDARSADDYCVFDDEVVIESKFDINKGANPGEEGVDFKIKKDFLKPEPWLEAAGTETEESRDERNN
ncbi:hypothetical protein JW711_05130 [Candidatus Woesearchaeota archaeon]|nr:hypothetical protein [Candidatus Woesearchaeota archaeon]